MHDDLAYLASPALSGRLAGTPGNDSAATFIAHRYFDLGLAGAYGGASCGLERCDSSYFQMFQLSPQTVTALDVVVSDITQNVGAIVRGTDSSLKSQFVIVGAHYDHIGRSNTYALDRIRSYRPGLHPGADDNASGTVAVLELARRFAEHPSRRSVLFANFGAEELGLIGSKAFVRNSPVPIDAIVAMINLDMVGRLRDDRLNLYVGEASERFHVVVDSVEHIPPALNFHFDWLPSWRGASDQISFSRAHVPVLGLFTDYHPDYHRSSDVVDRIDFPGLEKVVDFAERLVRAVADGNDRPSHVSKIP
ncbi:MAG TPA: M20/M25/M40 family metallo-hydrolase [Gemmatimonadaceae bacterium]|nr:M20/M25/M40 family metallo-hydrolase [Gemmatimonadaceae bacterium]